jgi:hypothetical protein
MKQAIIFSALMLGLCALCAPSPALADNASDDDFFNTSFSVNIFNHSGTAAIQLNFSDKDISLGAVPAAIAPDSYRYVQVPMPSNSNFYVIRRQPVYNTPSDHSTIR